MLTKTEARKMLDDLFEQKETIMRSYDHVSEDPSLSRCDVHSSEQITPSTTEVIMATGDVLGLNVRERDAEEIMEHIRVPENYGSGRLYRVKEILLAHSIREQLLNWGLAPLTLAMILIELTRSSAEHYNPKSKWISISPAYLEPATVSHEVTHFLSDKYNSPTRGRRLNEEGLATAVEFDVLSRWNLAGEIPIDNIELALVYCALKDNSKLKQYPGDLGAIVEEYQGIQFHDMPSASKWLMKEASAFWSSFYFLGHTKMWLLKRQYGEDTYAKVLRGEIKV